MREPMTKTMRARKLYMVLRKFDIISIEFTGLAGDALWVSHGRKAYRLKDLGDTHLANIIDVYIRNEEGIPGAIGDELARRRDARW